jgi:hypothetical protein
MTNASPNRFAQLLPEADRLLATNPAKASSLRLARDEFRRVYHSSSGRFTGSNGSPVAGAAKKLLDAICTFQDGQVQPGSAKPPATAMKFGAAVTIAAGDAVPDPLAEKTITIVARTDGEATQGYWGRCIHDMSGFIPPAGPVPLDYGHQDGQPSDVVGVADSMAVVNGQLIATGRLIPFAAGDSASEVIFKGSKGVPYQASINMDLATLEVVEVPEGHTLPVNGGNFEGPGFVFTRWSVVGIAILPYGADASTSVQFARQPTAAQRSKDSLAARVAACWTTKL